MGHNKIKNVAERLGRKLQFTPSFRPRRYAPLVLLAAALAESAHAPLVKAAQADGPATLASHSMVTSKKPDSTPKSPADEVMPFPFDPGVLSMEHDPLIDQPSLFDFKPHLPSNSHEPISISPTADGDSESRSMTNTGGAGGGSGTTDEWFGPNASLHSFGNGGGIDLIAPAGNGGGGGTVEPNAIRAVTITPIGVVPEPTAAPLLFGGFLLLGRRRGDVTAR